MAGEDAPNKVKRANKNRCREVTRLAKIERRLGKKMQEDPDLRPDLTELVLPPVTIEGYPYPPSSVGASSTASEATAENLLRGMEKLEAQEERMTEATTKLLAVVSEAGGGPWGADAGLTEPDLIVWLGVQQDRVEELKEKLNRREGEIARLAEVEEDESATAQERPEVNAAISRPQVSFRALEVGSMHTDLSMFPRLKRRKAKLGANMSRLRETVEGIGREGRSKRKADLI